MNDILQEYLDLIAMGILDDVIIFSELLAEHIPHVRSILEVLRQHKLYAKVEKCEFHEDQMTFVGYLVSKEGTSKVYAILDWPTPTTVKEVQSYLGFANFYRKFIKNFSSLTSPLTSLTRKILVVLGSGGRLFNSPASLHFFSYPAALPTKPIPHNRR